MNQGQEDQLRRNDPTAGKKVECDVAAVAVAWANSHLQYDTMPLQTSDSKRIARAIRKLASENAQLRATSAWRPMSRAPEREQILLLTPDNKYVGNAVTSIDGTHKGWRVGEASDGTQFILEFDRPIGWLPLPAAPSATEENDGTS